MGVAILSAKRSKDPSTQVGACVVNEDKRIIGIGYNGFPTGCKDEDFPWGKTDTNKLNTKYPYVVHAEPNAILNCTSNIKGATLYVTLFPCNECMKSIIQSGIKEVVYEDNKYDGKDFDLASKKMQQAANIKIRQVKVDKIELI